MSADTTPSSSVFQRQPALAAGGITTVVSLGLAAVWSILSDAHALAWLSAGTQAEITGFILAAVALIAAWWAQRRSTSTAAPKLPQGTKVEVTNEAGLTVGHVEVPALGASTATTAAPPTPPKL